MALILADLTTLALPPTDSASGWAPRGQLRASFRDVVAALRSPDFGLDVTEESTVWQIDTPAGRAQLQNWSGATYFLQSPDAVVTWTIQASDDAVLPWIYKIVTGSTAGFASSVRDLPFGADRRMLALAYLRYLGLREQTEHDVLDRLDPVSDRYRTGFHLWQQLMSASLILAVALKFERRTSPSDSRALEASLLDAAAQTPCQPWHDQDVHDEHVATVRALATATVPEQPVAAEAITE